MNSLIRTLLLAAFLALTSVSVDAMSNAELLARGLPLNPPHRRSSGMTPVRRGASAAPPQATIYPTSNGGYASTCKDITLTGLNSHVISADCQKFNGNYISGRTININECFSNVGGALTCSSSGGATNAECQDCTMSGTILTCKCKKNQTTRVSTSIDTNTCLANRNAALTCF